MSVSTISEYKRIAMLNKKIALILAFICCFFITITRTSEVSNGKKSTHSFSWQGTAILVGYFAFATAFYYYVWSPGLNYLGKHYYVPNRVSKLQEEALRNSNNLSDDAIAQFKEKTNNTKQIAAKFYNDYHRYPARDKADTYFGKIQKCLQENKNANLNEKSKCFNFEEKIS